MRRVTLLLALAALSGAASASAVERPPTSLRFHTCPADSGVGRTTACARLRVPLDYGRPGGRALTLTISAKYAAGTAGQRRGVLLVNPGGPGGEGLSLAASVWNALPEDLKEAYDVIGFDPRGIGHSSPLSCGLRRLYRPPLPDLTGAERPQVARARATAAACARRGRALLAHLDTQDTARDLDRIRAALGEEQISYLGYSYGTYLGEVYAQLFPGRVRGMILDSVVDPTVGGYADGFREDRAFAARFGDFLGWTARRWRRYRLGRSRTTVAAAIRGVRRRLVTRPVEGRVGPSELDLALGQALYSSAEWPTIAGALADYRAGRPDELGYAGQILLSAGDAPGLAITCRDSPWPRDWARWHVDTRRAFRIAPLTAWASTWSRAPCAFWPVPGLPLLPIDGTHAPPILLTQAERDPATPVAGARRVRRLYPGSRLVLVRGEGNHGEYLFNDNRCLDARGNAFLRTGALPARDVTCALHARAAHASQPRLRIR